jgi:hypothetical protein
LRFRATVDKAFHRIPFSQFSVSPLLDSELVYTRFIFRIAVKIRRRALRASISCSSKSSLGRNSFPILEDILS